LNFFPLLLEKAHLFPGGEGIKKILLWHKLNEGFHKAEAMFHRHRYDIPPCRAYPKVQGISLDKIKRPMNNE